LIKTFTAPSLFPSWIIDYFSFPFLSVMTTDGRSYLLLLWIPCFIAIAVRLLYSIEGVKERRRIRKSIRFDTSLCVEVRCLNTSSTIERSPIQIKIL
jgi:hypothetical protein